VISLTFYPLINILKWLYKSSYKTFKDVVKESLFNRDSTGFPAGPGWGVASGFGTPYFPDIMEMVLK
jgi:tripeptidyl-peptidase-1